MKFIVFAFVYPLIWVLSRLPMRILYLISNFLFVLVYYVVGYRKKVVISNIKTVFPEKNEKEVKLIAKKFFQHFTDLIVESVKFFSISEKEIKKRYTYKNINVINDLAEKGKSIMLMGGHYNNWEWSLGLPLHAKISCYGTYKKIQNPYFEKVLADSRSRFGYDGVITSLFIKNIEKRSKEDVQSLYFMLGDQSPQLKKTRYWSNFLNQFVPVFVGGEFLAKKHNLSVVNMNVTKVKRGYYEVDFKLITDEPSSYKDYEITEEYLRLTEEYVYKNPEYYLWSHRRFKHKDKYEEWKLKYKK
ncbi:MAG: lysophospholipid acyltransferase family protein [Tenacibaculum sp.]|nr:lysophospholipid acyltransferase family protein [Tenacibaculum sp.]